ncbi:MAG: BTAD domain-containing putative transcriptional regulator [Methyloligellaceae bacterium]
MAKLAIKLLGGCTFSDGQGNEVSLPARKARALLAYFALSAGQWHGRDRLAGLLWSDRQDAQARHSLTQALSTIRKMGEAAGVGLIESEGERVRLLGTATEVDALAFREMRESDPTSAVELYAGPLLDGFSVPDPTFEDWLKVERATLQDMACEAFERAAEHAKGHGDHRRAIDLAKRLVGLDPYREAGHRRLMELLAASGARTEAIRQFQACEKLLRDELGVEPAAETKALLEQIKDDETASAATVASDAEPAAPISDSPPVPDNPSVAVLPFTNMSGDPEQGYFADGIAEDLITALSNVRSFFVIDRSSSFTYKGRSADVKEVGQRLGVRYVLEGSVRKVGDKVRVSAQLVEASSGNHVWADRFDGNLGDVFEFQDKIVANVVGALEPQLLRAELERIRQKRPDNFDAYDLTLCGLSHMNKLTPEDTAAALSYFRKATDADASYARAYCCASWCYRRQVQLRGMILSEEEKAEALRLARAALQADSTDPYVLWQVGLTVALVEQDIEGGLSLIERSLAANSNSNRALLTSATVRGLSGDPQTAIEHAERAIQLSPLDTSMWVAFGVLANAHAQLANYDEAVVWGRRSVRLHQDYLPAHLALVASLAQVGQQLEAEKALSELQKVEPDLTLTSVQQRFPMDRFQNCQSFIEGLSKAGLPA